jgi:predicted XRE-type DNA-binding protein
MNKDKIGAITHKNTGDAVLELITNTEGIDIEYNLSRAMAQRGLTQRTLSLLTGIRQATISDMCNGVGVQINKAHLLALMITLRITDMSEIINIKFNKDVFEQFNAEAKEWIDTQQVPETVMRQALNNLNRK